MFLILGFTKRTSYTLALYLLKYYKNTLIISDNSKTEEQIYLLNELKKLGNIIDELGNHDCQLISQYPITKIFLSPGVPRTLPIIQMALEKGIEILNDIEFFYREFPYRQYIAITGTDGKTTVSTWLYNTIKKQKKVVLVGNIGIPIFEYADKKYTNYIFIIELSSFQLESISQFHAFIAVIINFHEDHMDRYLNKDMYFHAKKNIFMNQTSSDYALINHDNSMIAPLKQHLQAYSMSFSCVSQDAEWTYQQPWIMHKTKKYYDTTQLQVIGRHNIQNAMIVAIIATLINIKEEYIKLSLSEFHGLPHRLQFVKEIHNIKFFNDSKATTPHALQLALEAFDKPVLLLVGGRSKNLDFTSLKNFIHHKTKKIFYFGEMAHYLKDSWNDQYSTIYCNMEDAFDAAMNVAQAGDVVLLSPGGTSLDNYQSYSKRGEHFIELIKKYDK